MLGHRLRHALAAAHARPRRAGTRRRGRSRAHDGQTASRRLPQHFSSVSSGSRVGRVDGHAPRRWPCRSRRPGRAAAPAAGSSPVERSWRSKRSHSPGRRRARAPRPSTGPSRRRRGHRAHALSSCRLASQASARRAAARSAIARHVVVAEVEAAHPHRPLALGEQVADAALRRPGSSRRPRPLTPSPARGSCPRPAASLQRIASRNPNRSRSADGTTSLPGFCVAAHTITPAARPRATRSRSSSANSCRCALVGQRQIERQLVAHHQVQRQPVLAADLAQPAREQLAVALLHLRAHAPAAARSPARRPGPRRRSRDRRPRRELDQLAVQQPDPRVRIERAGGDQQRQRRRLARARLAADQHVALHQLDRHRLALLIDAERDRLPQRQRLRVGLRPRQRRGASNGSRRTNAHLRQRRVARDRAPPAPRAPAGTPPGARAAPPARRPTEPRRTRTRSTSPAATRATDHTRGHRSGPAATPASIAARAHARRTRVASERVAAASAAARRDQHTESPARRTTTAAASVARADAPATPLHDQRPRAAGELDPPAPQPDRQRIRASRRRRATAELPLAHHDLVRRPHTCCPPRASDRESTPRPSPTRAPLRAGRDADRLDAVRPERHARPVVHRPRHRHQAVELEHRALPDLRIAGHLDWMISAPSASSATTCRLYSSSPSLVGLVLLGLEVRHRPRRRRTHERQCDVSIGSLTSPPYLAGTVCLRRTRRRLARHPGRLYRLAGRFETSSTPKRPCTSAPTAVRARARRCSVRATIASSAGRSLLERSHDETRPSRIAARSPQAASATVIVRPAGRSSDRCTQARR